MFLRGLLNEIDILYMWEHEVSLSWFRVNISINKTSPNEFVDIENTFCYHPYQSLFQLVARVEEKIKLQ